MSDQTWVIPTSDLQVGTVLGFDLLDPTGKVLHVSGTPIHKELKETLAAHGITSVRIRGTDESVTVRAGSVLTSSFDPGIVHELNEAIEATQVAAAEALRCLSARQPIDSEKVNRSVEDFVETAGQDLAAALATLATHPSRQDQVLVEQLARRSAKLSLLGIITSLSQGLSARDTFEVGLAGLLHDCSLARYPRILEHNGVRPLVGEDLQAYRRHPLESAELLQHCAELPIRVLETISQVHEQADGTGFPKGLRLSETVRQAVILNLNDAYIALTESNSSHKLVPSDAIAYLVNHASRGRFCPMTVQAMMRGMSIYPIGTVVVLDDQTKAVVVRTNAESPMKPVVRALGSSQQWIDLLRSDRLIAGPFVDEAAGYQRIRKGDINHVYWRLDALPG